MIDDGRNIFDAIGAEDDITAEKEPAAAPRAPPPAAAPKNPFDAIAEEPAPTPLKAETSTFGAAVHHALPAVAPSAAGFAAFGAGAEAGGLLGGLTAGPPGALAGGVIGGLAASVLGAGVTEKVQDWALSKLPDTWKEAIGQTDRQKQLEEKEHGTASFLGGLAPFALTMKYGKIPKGLLPENPTALQTIMANPVTARVFGGGIMGGMEATQELAGGEHPDWTKVAISTGVGLILNKPNRLGERLTEYGARPVRTALGIPHPVEAPPAAPSPTLAELHDGKVMGPGVDEATARGGHEMDPEAQKTATETRQAEMQALGEGERAPDIHAAARQMHPELFAEHDALIAQRDELGTWLEEHRAPTDEAFNAALAKRDAAQKAIDDYQAARGSNRGTHELRKLRADYRMANKEYEDISGRRWTSKMGEPVAETPESAKVREHLMAVDYELRDKGREVAAAYRRAAESKTPERIIEPTPEEPESPPIPSESPLSAGETPPPSPALPIEAQKAQIAAEAERRALGAGENPEVAKAYGQVTAEKYATRAGIMKGALGSALDLYRKVGARIRGPGGIEAPTINAPHTPAAEDLRGMLNRGAPAAEVAKHPAFTEAAAKIESIQPTDQIWDHGTPEPSQRWKDNRQFNINGQPVKGYVAALPHIAAKAESYAGGPVTKGKQAYIVIGPPASGKSGFSERIATNERAAIVDSDDIKAILPEYQGGIGANAVHEESNHLAGRLLVDQLGKGHNIVVPKVGATPGSIEKLAQQAKAAGYNVHLINVNVSPENAFRRMVGRFLNTGRLINPDYFNSIGSKPTETYNILKEKELFKSHAEVDANGPRDQQPVTGNDGAKSALEEPGRERGRGLGGNAEGNGGRAQGEGTATGEVKAAVKATDTASEAATGGRALPAYKPSAEKAAAGPDLPAGVFIFKPTELNVDATRFQFKSGGDKYGVTGALRGVKKWDPAKAQSIIVWEQADGKLFVADGHQRAGLARRLTEQGHAKDIELPAVLYREKDGTTAESIRAIAAVTNIANGSGSALDGAKVLRARPDLIDASLPLSAGKGKQAAALARLDDDAFRMVINNVIPENYGAIVGDIIPNDGARQVAAAKAIAHFEPRNETEAATLTQRVAMAELAKAEEGKQISLFFDDSAESTVGEEMRIVGNAIKQMKGDKSLFKSVVANAERIEATGSTIEREAARSITEDAEIFEKILSTDAYAAGPVRDALTAAAKELKSGQIKIGEATARIRSALRARFEEGGLNWTGDITRAAEPAEAGRDAPVGERGAGKYEPAFERTDDEWEGLKQQARDNAPKELPGVPDFSIHFSIPGGMKEHATPHWIYAFSGGKKVGTLVLRAAEKEVFNVGGRPVYKYVPDGTVDLVSVPEEWRRKGIARELYKAAETAIGGKLRPSDELLGGGRLFWEGYRPEALEGHQNKPEGIAKSLEPSPAKEYAQPEFEPGAEGKPQQLMPGVKPVSDLDRIMLEAEKPLRGGQEPAGGMFDEEARNQKDLFQSTHGKVRLEPGKRPIITLFEKANPSTLLHETGHEWLEQMAEDAAHHAAPEQLRKDWQTTLKWLGVDSYDAIKTRHHEKWARGVEQYFREGVAPSKELAGVFERFKTWLIKVYQTLKGLGAPINDDIRGVFDRLLSEHPQRTVVAPEREPATALHHEHETDAALTPAEHAEPAADRIGAERAMALEDVQRIDPEVANEILPAVEKDRAERAAATGTEPTGEASSGAAGGGNVGPGGAQPGPVAKGGGMGEGNAAQRASGSQATGEGTGLFGEPRGPELPPLSSRPKPILESPSTVLDKAGNIRLDNLPDELAAAPDKMARFKDILREWADKNGDFAERQNGPQTLGQMLEGASKILGETPDAILSKKIGEAFNAKEMLAVQHMAARAVNAINETRALAAKTGKPEDVMAFAQATQQLNLIQGLYSQSLAEAGRALFAARKIKEFWTSPDAQTALRVAKEATGKTLFQQEQLARMSLALDTPEKIAKFAADQRKMNFGRMVLEYWINGLISSVFSQSTYLVTNTTMALYSNSVERALAAGVGAVAQKLGRKDAGVHIGEVAESFKGLGAGVAPGLKAGGQALKYGLAPTLPGEKVFSTPYETEQAMAPRGKYDANYQLNQVLPDLFGAIRGARDAVLTSGGLLAAGGHANAPLLGLEHSLRGEIPNIAVKGVTVLPLGDIARGPSRMNAFFDGIATAVSYSGEIAAQAARIAGNERAAGKFSTPGEYNARIADLRQNPTPEMMENAAKGARELSLMGKGGALTQRLMHLTSYEILGKVDEHGRPIPNSGVPVLKFIAPFVRVAGNTFEQSLAKRSVLGLFSQEIRNDLWGLNGPVAQDMAAARMIGGTVLAVAFGSLAAEGLMSGSGPSDPHEAAMWRLAGNQAHSARIGDFWYDLRAVGAMGTLANIAADIYDVSHKAATEDMDHAAGALLHAFTQNIVDQSFMKGPADLMKAVEDSDRYGASWVRTFLSSFVPYSTMTGQVARIADPHVRQARTIVDAMKAKIPGLSSELLPKRDIWGEEMPTRQLTAGFLTLYAQKIAEDPVNQAMLNLGISPAPVGRTIRNVELTDEQYDDFARIAGRMSKMRLDQIVNSPDFQTWPTHVRHDVMSEIIRQTRETARGIVMMKYPQIPQDAYAAKISKVKGE